jgi:stringent starvation protein B
VSVPDRFRGDARLVLRFGYELTPAIVDLTLDDAGLGGTLSFGGLPHRCRLPWAAIYAIVGEGDQQGMVWPDDVPAEIQADVRAVADDDDETIDDDDDEDAAAVEEPAEDAAVADGAEPRKKRGGHLRLVE